MIATTMAALAGLNLNLPELAGRVVFILLGVQIGATFTPATSSRIAQWPASLAILIVPVALITWASYLFYRRAFGWNRPTAFFAGNPGALSLTLLLAEKEDADLPRIAAVQGLRLLFMIVLIPALALAWRPGSMAATPAPAAAPLFDSALMLAAGALGGLAAERLKLPAGLMVGATMAVAALQLTGNAAGALPDWVLVPAFMLLGLMLGSRFCGFSPWLFFRLLGAGLAGFLVAVAVAAAGALTASAVTGIAPLVTLIAFAPGGLEAMTIMALALGLDPAFVGTHQIARFLLLSLALPMVVSVLGRHWRR